MPAGTPQIKTYAKRTARTQRRRAGREGGLFGRVTFHPYVNKQQNIFFQQQQQQITNTVMMITEQEQATPSHRTKIRILRIRTTAEDTAYRPRSIRQTDNPVKPSASVMQNFARQTEENPTKPAGAKQQHFQGWRMWGGKERERGRSTEPRKSRRTEQYFQGWKWSKQYCSSSKGGEVERGGMAQQQ